MSKLLEFVNADIAGQTLTERTPYKAGDTVNVHVKIKEGTKERIQQYQGVVIQIRNSGHPGMTFTVRKVSNGVGVERIFPVMSPSIEKVELVRQGKVRRARIYYLRDAKGKNARIKEKKRAVAAK